MATARLGAIPSGVLPRIQLIGVLPEDHDILKKLYVDILAWTVPARHLNSQWFVPFATGDSYAKEILAALAGLGIGVPLTAWMAGKSSGSNMVESLQSMFPGKWLILGIAAVVVYIALKAIVHIENVTAKAIFARDCKQTMEGFELELITALGERNPMLTITRLQKSINAAVATAKRNGVWPYDPLSPPDKIAKEIDQMIDQIRKKFMAGWDKAPKEERLPNVAA